MKPCLTRRELLETLVTQRGGMITEANLKAMQFCKKPNCICHDPEHTFTIDGKPDCCPQCFAVRDRVPEL